MCDKYEMSISGTNILSCEEFDVCTDLFVPAKCELYYGDNELRKFDQIVLGFKEPVE